jgi:hypothetical protein
MQCFCSGLGQDGVGGTDTLKGVTQLVKHTLSGIRGDKAPTNAANEGSLALCLKAAQTVTDGRWRNAQFSRCSGERSMTQHRLQYAKSCH